MSIMCTAGPNDTLWLTEAAGKDANGFEMLNVNGGKFALFLGNWGCCGSTWGPTEDLEIV